MSLSVTFERSRIGNDTLADPLAAYPPVNTAGTLNLARHAAWSYLWRLALVSSIRFAVKGNPTTIPTPHPKLRVAQARSADQSWVNKLVGSMKEHDTKDDAHVRRDLKKRISEYSHSSKPYLKMVSEKRAL